MKVILIVVVNLLDYFPFVVEIVVAVTVVETEKTGSDEYGVQVQILPLEQTRSEIEINVLHCKYHSVTTVLHAIYFR